MMRFPILFLLFGAALCSAAEIHRGLGPAPDTLDIHRAQGVSAFNLLRDLHEGLLTRDAHGHPVAGIAEDWTVSADGLQWHFRLDPAARWSDGSPIVAADFVRGFERAGAVQTASTTAQWLESVTAIEAIADRQLSITLARPVPWFEELLTLPIAFPVAESDESLYSGAFVLAREVPGSRFELEKNPHFRGAAQTRLDRVVWHVTEDASAEMARFRAGELHVTESVPPGRGEWLAREFGPAYRVAPYLGSFYLVYNLKRAPFEGNRPLRQALSLAIDREIIVERVLRTGEIPARRLVPPNMPGWPASDDGPRFPDTETRIEHARTLYRQAGFGPGQPLSVELRFNSSLAHRRLASAVAAMWKQHLGVRTRLINEEWKVFVTNRRQGRITEVVRGGWIADWADPGNFLGNFHSESPMNYAFFNDPDFDRLLDRAAGARASGRTKLLLEAEQRLLDSHALIPLYYYVSRHLVHPNVSGFEHNPMDIHLSRWLATDRTGRASSGKLSGVLEEPAAAGARPGAGRASANSTAPGRQRPGQR